MVEKMSIIVVLENEKLEKYVFQSFTEMCDTMENNNAKICMLSYDNKETSIHFSWNKDELINKGYFTISDICNALKNNTFVIR